ncbi:MAG: DmsC/YnfH family molybdoenzyme membrane anchor subunit [Lysobacterales bacterium]
MKPAPSLILFTTLSGTGFGMLGWLGLELLQGVAPRPIDLALACALAIAGLLASVAHLGQPLRAWRAFTQWRSSWLSREAWAAAFTLLLALLMLLPGWPLARWQGLPLALLSLGTVYCTAMIYHSLKPVPAWQVASVPATFVTLGLYSGAAVLLWSNPWRNYEWGVFCAVLAILPATQKLRYWKAVDGLALPSGSAAVGLSEGAAVANFEAPHTEQNYLTREFWFQVGRRHRQRLRQVVMLAAFVVAPAAMLAHVVWPAWRLPLAVVSLFGMTVGLLCERWLFFAEARHVVECYYRPDDSDVGPSRQR